jgi:uncharacterized UPF0146 family protein
MINKEIYRKNTNLYHWRCDEEIKKELVRISDEEERPINKILDDAVKEYLKKRNVKK